MHTALLHLHVANDVAELIEGDGLTAHVGTLWLGSVAGKAIDPGWPTMRPRLDTPNGLTPTQDRLRSGIGRVATPRHFLVGRLEGDLPRIPGCRPRQHEAREGAAPVAPQRCQGRLSEVRSGVPLAGGGPIVRMSASPLVAGTSRLRVRATASRIAAEQFARIRRQVAEAIGLG